MTTIASGDWYHVKIYIRISCPAITTMRPLNVKQRRSQFLLFIVLFVLATLPLLLVVYLHGRLDDAENRFLRDQYQANKESQRSKEANREMLDAEKKKVSDLSQYLLNKSPDMLSFKPNLSSTINVYRKKIDTDNLPTRDGIDSAMVDVVKELMNSIELLNEVYGKGCVNKEAYDELKEKHEKCPTGPTGY